MPANLLLTDAVALRRGARGVWEYSPACQAAARAYAVAFPAILRGLGLQVPTRTHTHTHATSSWRVRARTGPAR